MAAVAPVLITGVVGFIRFQASRRLLRDGGSVIKLDNVSDYYNPNLKEALRADFAKLDRFQFIKFSLADRGAAGRV